MKLKNWILKKMAQNSSTKFNEIDLSGFPMNHWIVLSLKHVPHEASHKISSTTLDVSEEIGNITQTCTHSA